MQGTRFGAFFGDFNFMAQSDSRAPQHLAMIMDGNGRWAEQRGLPRTAGHEAGEAHPPRPEEPAPRHLSEPAVRRVEHVEQGTGGVTG